MTERLSQRLASEFRQKIRQGQWAVGVQLPTNRDLAAEYGVSVNTIQHAFRELEEEDLVERRPRVGGYVKAGRVEVRASRSANTIGVVGPYTEEGYASEPTANWGHRIISGCDSELLAHGLHVSMFSYAVNDPNAFALVTEKIDQATGTLAGILCFPGPIRTKLLAELDRRNVPWVAVNRPQEHAAQNFVAHDAFGGSRLMGRCFARLGFERAAVLGTAMGSGVSASEKLFGFLEGWLESGQPLRSVDYLQCDGYREEEGYAAFRAHLDQFGPPRGVLASGDMLALGAIRACRESGLDVPAQVSVVGSTGLQLSAFSQPPLTVLETPMEQMGAEAAKMLLEMVQSGARRVIGRYAKVNVIVRQSCPIPDELLRCERELIEQAE